MFTRQATQPITIEQSLSQPVPMPMGHEQDSDDDHVDNDIDDSRDQDHHDHDRSGAGLSASFVLNSTFDNLTVGSLPSSRRERRFMVSHGNNERFSGAGTGIGSGTGAGAGSFGHGHGHRNGAYSHSSHNQKSSSRYGDLSRSMPNAPSLASRRDRASGIRLERIPCMRLPESVTDSEASSVPYGSLNSSQFRLPDRMRNGNNHGSLSSSHHAQSGLMSNSSSVDIRTKVQQVHRGGAVLVKNDGGGLASLFGARNDIDRGESAAGSIGNSLSSAGGNGNGVGGSITMNRGSALTGIESQINMQSPDQSSELQSQWKNEDINGRSSGGIGSMIEQSSLSQNMNMNMNLETTVPIYTQNDYSFRDGIQISPAASLRSAASGTAMNMPIHSDTNENSLYNNDNNIIDGEQTQLSNSLTGLSILQTSPKNMVNLQREEMEALANLRSRKFSEDGKIFLASGARHGDVTSNMNLNCGMAMADNNIPGIGSSEERHGRANGVFEHFQSAGRRLSIGSSHSHPDSDEGDDTSDGLFDLEMDM